MDETKMNTLLSIYENTVRVSGGVSSNPARPAQDLYAFYRLAQPKDEKVVVNFEGLWLLWKK